ncbi:transporter substrate-binding domain-containing protein [Microbacterium album]|uniref:ABC transporter substrate-binding protein n=1 Tax=Microbacterium album TaxID=2053191 RepID=A0A917IG63_9MICO|nr:transporter substrate-binding domain-containing protein [Microbacterium album]GGH43069.1 ABC transporter substrate-binding protein [Microbacterium album]
MIEPQTRTRFGLLAVALTSTALVLTACSADAPETPSAPAAGTNEVYDMLPDAIKEAGVIRAGGLFQTPPVLGAAADDPTTPVGIAPDLAAKIEPILGVRIEFVDTQWPNQIPGLQSGNLDVLWGQISDNAERERSAFDFVPFLGSDQGLLTQAGNPQGIDSIASMCGLTLALPNGGNQGEIVAAISAERCEAAGEPAIRQLPLQGGADAYSAVKAGTADAWMDVRSSVEQVAASDTAFEVVHVDIEEIPLEMRNVSGIAVSKENPGLTEALFEAMSRIVEDGEYLAVLEEYDVAADAIPEELFSINPFTNTPVGEMAG